MQKLRNFFVLLLLCIFFILQFFIYPECNFSKPAFGYSKTNKSSEKAAAKSSEPDTYRISDMDKGFHIVLPAVQSKYKSFPSIEAKAGLTLDVSSNTVIYSKNIHTKLYPASTTKLLTAILLAENMTKNSVLHYSSLAKAQDPSKLNLDLNQTLSASDAMNAMLIFSANDVAYCIGENISGSNKEFAKLMNKQVQDMGLKDTHFMNPNGLHQYGHYTTAYDLCVIAREAYCFSWIMDTLKKESGSVMTPSRGKIVYSGHNRLLGKDGCIGGKTGYTEEAGRCLVSYFYRNGRLMIGVILGDPNNDIFYNDMLNIINWSYSVNIH